MTTEQLSLLEAIKETAERGFFDPYKLHKVLIDVVYEIRRQAVLKEEGRFETCSYDPGGLPQDKLIILGEEFGELCGAISADSGASSDRRKGETLKELNQVAAVAVGWLVAEQ